MPELQACKNIWGEELSVRNYAMPVNIN